MALKGIRWDDKKYFFDALEDSVAGIAELDDTDEFKQQFVTELSANHQKLDRFHLKLGHKNLIINLCHELQKTNLEEFNGNVLVQLPSPKYCYGEVIVRKKAEEHGYSREEEQAKRRKIEVPAQFGVTKQQQIQEVPVQEVSEQEEVPYMYETEEEEETNAFMEQLDEYEQHDDLETYEEGEVVYQEVDAEEIDGDENCVYTSEVVVKNDGGHYEQVEDYEVSGYDSSTSVNRSTPKNKRPKHMYTEEFLQTQMTHGRIGTPGRRRPKIQKHYPENDEGMLEKWADLVRQSCEVIVPYDLLHQHDLSIIELVKIHDNIWEVKCPLCTKKLRLQLTHEGMSFILAF